MKILLCCLLLAMLLPVGQSTTDNTQPFRTIDILKRENGYGNFESVAFQSQKDLDSFLNKVALQGGWNRKGEFVNALRNANVDFSKEALVLLRHYEGSGSVNVEFKAPVLEGKKLVCEIEGIPIPEGFGGTGDVAYYCMAVVVSKTHISQVELQATRGGFKAQRLAPIVFKINEK
jgi:hypothetical protein